MTTVQTNKEVSQSLLDSINGTNKGKKSSAEEAQDRFMTLLVTQMKNQDPLNPLDNAQVTSQLAQLSTVTGIDRLNTTLESMMSNMQSTQTLQLSNLIGREALVAGNQIHFDGSAGHFAVELPSGVDELNITVNDSAGNAVRTIALGRQNEGILPLSWDGYSDAGTLLPKGDYTFTVNAKSGGQTTSVNKLSLEQIYSISSGANGIKLNLSNATSVSASDLKQIF